MTLDQGLPVLLEYEWAAEPASRTTALEYPRERPLDRELARLAALLARNLVFLEAIMWVRFGD